MYQRASPTVISLQMGAWVPGLSLVQIDLSLGYAFGPLSASMCSAGTLALRSEPIV